MFSSYAKPGNDTIEKETGYGLRWVRLCVHLLRGKKVHKLSCPEIGIVRCEKRDGSGGKAPRDLTSHRPDDYIRRCRCLWESNAHRLAHRVRRRFPSWNYLAIVLPFRPMDCSTLARYVEKFVRTNFEIGISILSYLTNDEILNEKEYQLFVRYIRNITIFARPKNWEISGRKNIAKVFILIKCKKDR